MILFPPAAAVTVVLDGAPIRTYQPAYVFRGRTYAPVTPFLSRVADRISYDGVRVVIQRGDRMVRAVAHGPAPDVPLAPVLRALGARVSYHDRTLFVTFDRARTLATPTPFDPAAPSAAPRAVFTPVAAPTPRPVWTGAPLPRRTPIPFSVPTATATQERRDHDRRDCVRSARAWQPRPRR